MKVKPRYIIGVDPGVHTGIAVYDRESNRLDLLRTCTAERATETVSNLVDVYTGFGGQPVLVKVENPSFNLPVFNQGERLNDRALLKKAQNVGMNKRDATILINQLAAAGVDVEGIRPSRKKWSTDFFRSVTGWQGRTNQHERDAARVCWGA